jgi:hypothetical protein
LEPANRTLKNIKEILKIGGDLIMETQMKDRLLKIKTKAQRKEIKRQKHNIEEPKLTYVLTKRLRKPCGIHPHHRKFPE